MTLIDKIRKMTLIDKITNKIVEEYTHPKMMALDYCRPHVSQVHTSTEQRPFSRIVFDKTCFDIYIRDNNLCLMPFDYDAVRMPLGDPDLISKAAKVMIDFHRNPGSFNRQLDLSRGPGPGYD